MNREQIKVTFLSYEVVEDTDVSLVVKFSDDFESPSRDACIVIKQPIYGKIYSSDKRYEVDTNCWFYINNTWYTILEESYLMIRKNDEIELQRCPNHHGFKIYEDKIKLELGEINEDEFYGDLLDDPE